MRWFLVFALVVIVGGVAFAFAHLGSLAPEVLLDRPGVVLLMVVSCVALAATPGGVGALESLIGWFIKSAAALNGLALAGGIARYSFGIANPMLYQGDSLRLSGFMLNPNTYGGFLAVALIAQASALAIGTPIFRNRWLEVGNGAALLAGLILTISRGAWIGAVVGLLFLLAIIGTRLRRWNLRPSRLVVPAVAAAVLVLLIAATQWAGIPRVGEIGTESPALRSRLDLYRPQGGSLLHELMRIASDPSGAEDRWAIIRAAFALYRESVWSTFFGIGGGAFAERSERTSLAFRTTIHNTYVWALVEHGVPGVMLLLAFLASLIAGLVDAFRRAPGTDFSSTVLLSALVCILAIFLTHNGVTERYVWSVWGLSFFRLRLAQAPVGAGR